MGINPGILKFLVALLIAGAFISLLEQSSKGAAIAIAFILVLLMFLKSPLPYWLDMGSKSLQKGIS